MCSQNLMGVAGEKIDAVAGAMFTESPATLETRETRLLGEIKVKATSYRSCLGVAGQ